MLRRVWQRVSISSEANIDFVFTIMLYAMIIVIIDVVIVVIPIKNDNDHIDRATDVNGCAIINY